MIELDQLTKKFGTFTAVDHLSFEVPKGQVLGFLGPNGAGKSTTMKMITGYLVPTEGKARVCGFDVTNDPVAVKSRLGYLPEGAPSWPDMTPQSFLTFAAKIRGIRGKDTAIAVAAAVEKANLSHVLDQPIATLSKGFKRRVSLGYALLHDPDVLILDEPTDGLDPNQKHDVRDLIREMASEKAIIVSTHILEEVEAVCSRAIIIDQGRIVADGTPEELEAQSTRHNGIRLGLDASIRDKALGILTSFDPVAGVDDAPGGLFVRPANGENIAAQVAERLKAENITPQEFYVERGRLDDVFRQLTEGEISTPTTESAHA